MTQYREKFLNSRPVDLTIQMTKEKEGDEYVGEQVKNLFISVRKSAQPHGI